jgi:hypothetical protein
MTRRYYQYEDSHRTVRGVKQKLCIRCKKWKDESLFHRNRRSKDGIQWKCKECERKYARKRYNRIRKTDRRNLRYEDRHRVVNGVKEKLCRNCRKWKSENQYYKEPRTKDGLKSWCKDCVLKYQRERNRKIGKGLKTLRRYEECHRVVSGVKQKKCTRCKRWKTESEFYKNIRNKDGLQFPCKACSDKATNKSHKKRRLAV